MVTCANTVTDPWTVAVNTYILLYEYLFKQLKDDFQRGEKNKRGQQKLNSK